MKLSQFSKKKKKKTIVNNRINTDKVFTYVCGEQLWL